MHDNCYLFLEVLKALAFMLGFLCFLMGFIPTTSDSLWDKTKHWIVGGGVMLGIGLGVL